MNLTQHNVAPRRLQHAVARWAWVLALSVLGAIAFELILPFAWGYGQSVYLPYSPPFIDLITLVVTLLLAYAISEPIRLRVPHWRRIVWYPPVWLAIPASLALAAGSEHLRAGIRPLGEGPDWQHAYVVLPTAVAVLMAVCLRQLPLQRKRRVARYRATAREPELTWGDIELWLSTGERPIVAGERDLFRHARIADRLTRGIEEGRRVALLGRFGTGKSSIVNLLKGRLADSTHTFILTEFDVWAVPKPEDVPRLALNRVVAALDDYVDTIGLRRLPLTYQRLAAAEPSGRLAKALGLDDAVDSIELIEEVQRILETLDSRLLLIVQDVERAGPSFETRHLQRLLWAMRRFSRVSFVLSVDPDHAPLDFPKLCESIELVPKIEVEQVASLLAVAYGHWRTQFHDIDTHPDGEPGDKLGLNAFLVTGATESADPLMKYLQRTGRDTPLDALVSLLQTPRSLKQVLGRVDRAWRELHGEAELDDIVIVSALRHGAEPVYRFLLADIDAARHKPDRMFPRTQQVKSEWDTLLSTLPNASAVQRLVDLMGIEQLTEKGIRIGVQSRQDVSESEPVDYFRRIAAEEIGPFELRDQAVLRDIEQWRTDRSGELVQRLVATTDLDNRYAALWEHFSDTHSESELMEITGAVVDHLLERDGTGAAADHPGLIALWRKCNRRLKTNEHALWLRDLLSRTVPVSLHLLTGLYYYWTGNRGVVDGEERTRIRQSVVDAVRATIRTGADLIRVLTPDHPYSIVRLITQTGTDDSVDTFEAWSDYLPTIVIDGAKLQPDLVLPELANLAADRESGIVAAGGEYPPRFINRYTIARDRTSALFQGRLDEALTLLASYAGENAYAVRAKEDARLWLDERRREDEQRRQS